PLGFREPVQHRLRLRVPGDRRGGDRRCVDQRRRRHRARHGARRAAARLRRLGAAAPRHSRHVTGRYIRRGDPHRAAHRPDGARAGYRQPPEGAAMTATDTHAPASAQDAAPLRPLWQVVLIRPETMTFVLLILGLIGGTLLSPYFLDVDYIL